MIKKQSNKMDGNFMRKKFITKGGCILISAVFFLQALSFNISAKGIDSGRKKLPESISCVQMDNSFFNVSGETPVADIEKLPDISRSTKPDDGLPDAYDLRSSGRMTSVKDQGKEGLCWSYSTLAAAESNILSQNLDVPDVLKKDGELCLSVGHMGYYTYTNDPKNDISLSGDWISADAKGSTGGNCDIAAAIMASGRGLQHEIFTDTADFADGYSEYQRDSSFYRLKYSQYLKKVKSQEDIAAVKSWIIENGAVDVSFYNSASFYTKNKDSTAYYQNVYSGKNTNHEVVIAGWDDNYPASNFASSGGTPDSDGAWLIKNSWGEKLSADGYIWISYSEPSLTSFMQYVMEPIEESDNIIQYDSSVCINAYNFEATANVFTAENNQVLKSIGFYIYSLLNTSIWYDAEIYLLDDDFTSPEDGTLVRQISGKYDYTGYKKVDLENILSLKKGQKYSVVLRYKYKNSEGKTAYSPIEENCSSSWCDFIYTSNERESYILESGSWKDTIRYEGQYGEFGNLPIKAYTDDTDEKSLEAAKSSLDNAVGMLKANETFRTLVTLDEYKLADLVMSSPHYLSSPSMVRNAAYNIFAYLEGIHLITFPKNAVMEYGLGDLNKDGTVNSMDATVILAAYADYILTQKIDLTYSQQMAADVNRDEKIDSKDATMILTYYAKQILSAEKIDFEQYAAN